MRTFPDLIEIYRKKKLGKGDVRSVVEDVRKEAPVTVGPAAAAPVIVVAQVQDEIKDGDYTLDEMELSPEKKRVLHGRAFIYDRAAISNTSSEDPYTFYIATDTRKGLIVPGRSMVIENNGPGALYYRWTDDGEHWTEWVSIFDPKGHKYAVEEKCRFAEVQVYVTVSGSRMSIRATR